MKVDLTTQFLDINDKPMIDNMSNEPITLRTTLINAVLADVDEMGQPVRGDAKVKRYDLYLKIKMAGEQTSFDITPEEATVLREAVGIFATLIAGQARDALNPKQ